MEEGSLRCDANVSIRKIGQRELGTKTEVKNMNSFKSVQKALESEIKRQTEMLESGERIVQETRLFDDTTGTTTPMRSKEEAHDYRYFPEPDLVPIEPDKKWVDEIAKTITELPSAKKEKYIKEFGLPEMNASILTSNKNMSDFFDEALKIDPTLALGSSNMLIGEVSAYCNDNKKDISETSLRPDHLIEILKGIDAGVISRTSAKKVIIKVMDTGENVKDIISESGATQISDEKELLNIISDVISNNTKSVADYMSGKENALFFLMGQVMKATKGRANPEVLKKLLIKQIKK
jgi:aspartyl-tRNA(Asn)/glutamyl-tRNA(Gln) amidotransferase subunit B